MKTTSKKRSLAKQLTGTITVLAEVHHDTKRASVLERQSIQHYATEALRDANEKVFKKHD